MGLRVDENGLLLPREIIEGLNEDDVDGDDSIVVEEDMMSNALVWLLGKIVNFLAAGDGINPGDFELPPELRSPIGFSQESLLQRWKMLELELQTWHDSLPPTFTEVARTTMHDLDLSIRSKAKSITSNTVWYSIPMCAATMQSYHMARILLLLNRPQESTAVRSTVTARMRSYHNIQKAVLYHSREICAISLSKLPDAVRIHSLQPLFVAGQCLPHPAEHEVVLMLLQNIQQDLGWATDYRVRKLQEEWEAE